MIKHIIFDMDGVLVDARDIHYEALNEALKKIDHNYIIGRQEHLSSYDGLPTKKKLEKLTMDKGLPPSKHDFVWKKKQDATLRIIDKLRPDKYMASILKQLKADGYTIHVCSNSVKRTIETMLEKKGLLRLVDKIFSNQDVKTPKPNPEVFLRSIIDVGVSPRETLVIEDSPIGRRAAVASCAHLHAVRGTYDVHYEEISHTIDKINKAEKMNRPKWQGKNMNVLIPMAGAGSRFEQAGYTFPKPLIEVNGKPMIQLVVENLNIEAKHIFIVQKSHCEQFNLRNMLSTISPNCEVVEVDGVTEGAACTTLLAKELIDNDEPLLMANSDQYVDWDSSEFMYSMIGDGSDAGILTFESLHPKWSYVRLDDNGFVSEVAEKNPISNRATVGIYYWNKGSDYVKYAEEMINKDIRHNNEFYVCPVFNQAIEDGKKVKIFNIDSKDMWGLGTPEDLNTFVNSKRL